MGDDCARQHMGSKVIRGKAFPLTFDRGVSWDAHNESSTLYAAILNPVVHYGRSIVRVNAQPVTRQQAVPYRRRSAAAAAKIDWPRHCSV